MGLNRLKANSSKPVMVKGYSGKGWNSLEGQDLPYTQGVGGYLRPPAKLLNPKAPNRDRFGACGIFRLLSQHLASTSSR